MCRNGTDNPFAYYNYDSPNGLCDGGPTEWITILFLALFAATTATHLLQAILYRKWFFIPTMVTGGFGELVGWTGRLWSSRNPDNFQAFIMQITTTIFSPSFMTAANFIVLGQTIAYSKAQRYARLSPRKFTWVFLSFDVACLFIQSAGGGIASTNNVDQARVGSDIALVGIALQTAAIAIYSVVAGEFIWRLSADKPLRSVEAQALIEKKRIRKSRTPEQESESYNLDNVEAGPGRFGKRIPGHVQLIFLGLAISTLFLLIRAIYRLIEFADGWGHRIQSTETYFNVLDGGCIVVSMVAINILHPGWLIKRYGTDAY